MVRTLSVAQARATFSELLGSVHYTNEPVIVEKKGRPYAVLISPEDYQRFRQAEERDWALVDQVQARNSEKDPDDMLADVTAELEAARQEHHAEQEHAGSSRR